MEGEILSQWKQALYVLSQIPLEIRLDIYCYTLIAENPIQLRDEANSKALYRWQEPCEDATQELKRASEFYLWATQKHQHIKHEEIHDYFLSHNVFSIQNKVGSDTLVKTVQDLSKAGFKTNVHGLDIVIKGSKVSVEDADEGRRMLPKPKDYARVDPGTPAMGAYRILKPLTKLSRLRILNITLRESRKSWPFFHIPFHDAYVIVPTVIARLRELVHASSKTPVFKVRHQIAVGTDFEVDEDISTMWNPPKSKEKRKRLPELFKEMGFSVMSVHDIMMEEEMEMDDDAIYNEILRSDDDLPWNYEPTYSDLEEWGY